MNLITEIIYREKKKLWEANVYNARKVVNNLCEIVFQEYYDTEDEANEAADRYMNKEQKK